MSGQYFSILYPRNRDLHIFNRSKIQNFFHINPIFTLILCDISSYPQNVTRSQFAQSSIKFGKNVLPPNFLGWYGYDSEYFSCMSETCLCAINTKFKIKNKLKKLLPKVEHSVIQFSILQHLIKTTVDGNST